MDISSLVGTLMSSDALKNIGKTANVTSDEAKNVLSAAIPSLLKGAKAQSGDTSTGFADALISHGKNDTSDLASFLGKVDLADGGKIIGHLLGGNSSSEIDDIAKSAGVSKAKTSSILSAAAPLLMSLLGKQASADSNSSSASDIGSAASSLLGKLDIGDILGVILGGKGDSNSSSSSALGNIGGILGGLFKK